MLFHYLRTGYLLDVFSISETTAREFGVKLQKADLLFKDLLSVFHSALEQLFFINMSLLQVRIKEAHSTTPWTSFMHLTPISQEPFSEVPPEILLTLTACTHPTFTSPPLTTAISPLTPAQSIALAGFLLEYPVAYFPSEMDTQGSDAQFLHNVPLHVFECILLPGPGSSSSRHTFMKFSCPRSRIDGGTLATKIKQRFEDRLAQLSSSSLGGQWQTVEVRYETRTLDRVAL
ncbi:hypothetical protein K439DRAFT_351937 [Ramaria rubella]|nr:hypothetical protein K439DRAFT_351937 [Ramaria rubella]